MGESCPAAVPYCAPVFNDSDGTWHRLLHRMDWAGCPLPTQASAPTQEVQCLGYSGRDLARNYDDVLVYGNGALH
jgi:hypothetical protein